MTELTQPTHRERTANAGGLSGLFDDQHEPNGLVTVAVGPYVERLPLGNSSVAQIRARFGLRFDIDPRTQAVLDGHEVGDDTVVRTGQVLMFVHKSGEKGCRKVQDPGSKAQRSSMLPRLNTEHWKNTGRQRVGVETQVAQSCTLLYRGFATRRAPVEAGAEEHFLKPLPIENRRYSRVQLCATSRPGPLHG